MSKIQLNIDSDVFNPVYKPYLDDDTPTQIFFGGASSGKSYFLAQRAVIDVAKGGRNYLILRKVQRDCRKSVWNEVVKQLKFFGLWDYVETNKTEMTITFPNGYQIIFGGLDDRERIKSITPEKSVITDIWLEEATEFEQGDYKQLTKRLRGQTDVVKRIILSFNPIIKNHWIYKRFFNDWDESKQKFQSDRLSILKTTYKDNQFLTEDDIERLEDEEDPYYIDVYLKGNWGVLGNIIFKNWEVRDLSEVRANLSRHSNGLDFGFTNDPTALIRCHYDSSKGVLYILDEWYQHGATNDLIAEKAREIIGREVLICDSAEPKSIHDLQRMGVNAIGAEKGPDSVRLGIDWLKRQKIIIDTGCVNVKRELQTYQWKEDRHGNVLNEPQDKNNHAIDAIRYAVEEYSMGVEEEETITYHESVNISPF